MPATVTEATPPTPAVHVVRLEPLTDLPALRASWLELESRSDCSYFLTWAWIGEWLQLICDQRIVRVLSVFEGSRLVALGLITTRRRFRGLGPRHLRLHEAGSKALDSLTVEYNGLLSEAGRMPAALAAAVDFLVREQPRWHILYLPGIDSRDLPMQSLAAQPLEMRVRRHATPFVDLHAIRAAGGDYIASLSKKTRFKLRRTARDIAGNSGALEFTVADGPRQAHEFLHALVALHQAHWCNKPGGGGAFADPRILRFHERQVAKSTAQCGVQLARLCAGERPIGYAYHFIRDKVVYYYQAGIDYAGFASLGSPGMLLLAHAIQHAADNGMARYELMAGESPYKRRLANGAGEMLWLSLDRPGLLTQARRLRQAFRKA